MSTSIMHPHLYAVKHGRFVASTPEGQADLERQIGRNLYRRGKPLRECVTDDMAAGWLAAERTGADAYYGEMARDGAYKAVNWNSGAEVW